MKAILEELNDTQITAELAAIGQLSPVQSDKLNALFAYCMALKAKNLALIKDRRFYIAGAEYNSKQAIDLDGHVPARLAQADLDLFSMHGVAGPFRLIDDAEARDLERHIEDLAFSRDNPVYRLIAGRDRAEADLLLEERDVILGVNMFMFDTRVRAIFSDPDLLGTVKDLIATDRVTCWRSQIFRQMPDGSRTFYHQNVDFADMSRHPSFAHRSGKRFEPN